MIKTIEWQIPIHTVSEANTQEHWTKKKKRHDLQKRWIWLFFKKERPDISFPCHIKLTRIGKKMLDSDNLPVSMKWIRDTVADTLIPGKAPGQADNDPGLSWEYDQQIGKEYAVKIEFVMRSI